MADSDGYTNVGGGGSYGTGYKVKKSSLGTGVRSGPVNPVARATYRAKLAGRK